MKKILALIAAGLLLTGGIADARNVTVTGNGVSQSEAEGDALRNAIEKAVGVLVDSQTLVSKNTVLQDEIYTQSKGFITNYNVVNQQQNGNGWEVTVNADVDDSPNSKLMSELTRLGIIDVKLRNPKIAVYIPEHHIQYRIPDPAGETAVIKSLVEAGFTNVIAASPKAVMINPNSYGWLWKPIVQINVEDMRSAARFFDADILIIGEAFSEGVGDVGQWIPGHHRTGMQSCRARVEAKMYVATTGQIIAADGKYGSGADISQSVASKKALATAGEQLGEYFLDKLMETGSGNRQGIEVVVLGASASKVSLVQSAMNRVSKIKNVQMSSYSQGKGVFSVQYSGAPQTLFKEIQAATDADLEMKAASYNTLTIVVH
ncbi:MAG TPA: hypothetical protein DDY92_05570 [Dialister sp.]|nr:hypothetical protein [Dialister sp.]